MILFMFSFKHLIMSKRIRHSVSLAEEWETDWLKYFLCQVDTSEPLILPDKKTNPKAGSGLSLAINIPQFHMINEMPIAIGFRRIDDGDGIESTLVRHKARYHESCKRRGKRKVQEVPQSQTAALTGHQEEEETEQAQIEQTYGKH